MTVLEIISRSTDYLASRGVESPRLQIELMLAHVLQVPRLNLYLDFERKLTEAELDALRTMVRRRGNREPLQHILGTTSFCGFEIEVSPAVLIPRPETEILAEKAWKFLQERVAETGGPVSALDFGTGSGCMAVAVASNVPEARVVGIDVSEEAAGVARANAERNRVAERVQIYVGDAFRALPAGMEFDLILSNPPYIPSEEIERLAPEVRNYDPRLALDGGADGLYFYRLLAAESRRFLRAGGKLMLEIGDSQGEVIRLILESHGWQVEAVDPDYSGRARIVVAHPVI